MNKQYKDFDDKDFEDDMLEGPDAEFRMTLWSHQLKATKCRVDLLKLLNDESGPLSIDDISTKLKGSCSRATVYRTLDKLVECGLVTRSFNGTQSALKRVVFSLEFKIEKP